MSSTQPTYDYAFIGMGCANSLILLELHRLGMLAERKIIIYEPLQKVANDRTFCFWLEPEQLEASQLTNLVAHSWSAVRVNEQDPQQLDGKKYYYLRADALYAQVRALLSLYAHVWEGSELRGAHEQLATWVFDSRPPKFAHKKPGAVFIDQSFYGWLIRTEQAVFDAEVFTMMDFSIEQAGHTQFLYILPFDGYTALIEPTRFGNEHISEQEASSLILKFLAERNTKFEVLEKEKGCIPMCSAPLQKENLPAQWLRTGAGSGQLKPSTGYSFVRALTDAQQITASILAEHTPPERRKSASRFAFYDRLLLQILSKEPQRGKEVFGSLFKKNKASDVLHFLDEQTTLVQELRIMSSLPIFLFLKAAFKDVVFSLFNQLSKLSIGLLSTLICLLFEILNLQSSTDVILIIGLLLLGLPHGALDHLPMQVHSGKKLRKFVSSYLGISALLLLVWWLQPIVALCIFIAYTAWHFGQADFEYWRHKAGFYSFLWGLLVLALILFGHVEETLEILKQMDIELNLYPGDIKSLRTFGLVSTLCFWVVYRKNPFIAKLAETLALLLIGFWLPLLPAFGCYFIFQHSLHGWAHLKNKTKYADFQLWTHALPFTCGSLVLFGTYLMMIDQPNWGQVFIFLSALSLPHVFYMHNTYRN
ncbi:MAG: beta-carotene 15,15'-dioxygenase, Brp/Blh family [Flavobacteriales bacterium]